MHDRENCNVIDKEEEDEEFRKEKAITINVTSMRIGGVE